MNKHTIFITGASGGLGRALALSCAARGATVVLHGRKAEKLDAVYDEIVAAGHAEPFIMPLDFTQASVTAFDDIAHALTKEVGVVNALVHCAAALGSVSPIEQQTTENLRTTWLVNAMGPMMLTRALAGTLRAASARGSAPKVLFTSDSHVQTPGPFWGGYGVSKAAINHFAEMLAQEWDFADVRAIVPGEMDSPLRQKTHPGESKHARIPLTTVVAHYMAILDASPSPAAD